MYKQRMSKKGLDHVPLYRRSTRQRSNSYIKPSYRVSRSVVSLISCYCFIIIAAVIILWLGALLLLFVLLYSQRVASHSCETFRQLLHGPEFPEAQKQKKCLKEKIHEHETMAFWHTTVSYYTLGHKILHMHNNKSLVIAINLGRLPQFSPVGFPLLENIDDVLSFK